jgi:hypothetical protein
VTSEYVCHRDCELQEVQELEKAAKGVPASEKKTRVIKFIEFKMNLLKSNEMDLPRLAPFDARRLVCHDWPVDISNLTC